MKAKVLAVIAMAAVCLGCSTKSHVGAAKEIVAKAERILRGENVVPSKEYVNSSGHSNPTEQTWAFSVISEMSENPTEVFRRLAESRSYFGLIGLRKYDPQVFREMVGKFRGEPTVYFVTNDAFEVEEKAEFLSALARDEKSEIFDRLIWTPIPDWTKTIRVHHPGENR